MMNELEIRTLTERFFNGETTLAEERRLYQLYSEAESLPADLEELREMMADLGALETSCRDVACSPSTDEQSEALMLTGNEPRPYARSQNWGWISIAASLLLFFTLGSMWYGYQQNNECVAYVYGERVTDRELVMHEMQTAMASLTTDDATATMEQQMKELFSE